MFNTKHWNCLIQIVYYLFKYACVSMHVITILEIRYVVAFHCFFVLFSYLPLCLSEKKSCHLSVRPSVSIHVHIVRNLTLI